MDMINCHVKAMQVGANLHPDFDLFPGANLHSSAICAYENGFKHLISFYKLKN